MGKRRDEIKRGSRREFLRGATVAAGGVALIGSELPALGQIPSASQASPGGQLDSVVRPSPQIPGADQGPAGGTQQPPGADQSAAGGPPGKRPVRASAPAETHLRHLGPLHNLAGTWVGSGFNLISLPDFADNKTFRLKLSATREILEFSHIGGPVPKPWLAARRHQPFWAHLLTTGQRCRDERGAPH